MRDQTLILCIVAAIMTGANAQDTAFMPMIFVEGGSFIMGSDNDESHGDEQPLHNVKLSSFYIGKYEVTVAQYRRYCTETHITMPEPPEKGWNDNDPITNIDWNDTNKFALWMSERTGRAYRLPTEAQWEYAARGGQCTQGRTYAGSDSLDLVSWFNKNSDEQVHPIGQKCPNELGIYDMSGNVWEWARDWYSINYYSQSSDTEPENQTRSKYRVRRGGSWDCGPQFCRSVDRHITDPEFRDFRCGFRLVYQ